MDLNFANAKLKSLIIHIVGNKLNNEKYILSNSPIEKYASDMESLLVSYFLSPFRHSEYFTFWHESNMKLNATYSFVQEIFADTNSFITNSKNIAKHLYEQSTHPKIKEGELYISLFENCILENKIVDVIGIYKSETKDTFLQTTRTGNHFEINLQKGLNTDKVDKACLIFSNKHDNNYKVCVIDNTNKLNEAQYWKDDFLKIKACSDSYHFTKNYLSVAKEFITKQLTNEYDISKTSQIDLLNKSVDYFKENEIFAVKEFEKTVFDDPDIIKSFRKFGSSYMDYNDIDLSDRFEISIQAVKKQARIFKSVLKLDKNFHIYIHGNNDLIEQGYDSKVGKKYYKIYYDEEK